MAQIITRTFPDGDYPARLAAAYAAFEAARQAEEDGTAPTRTLDEPDPVEVLAQEYRALKAEAEADAAEKGRTVTLKALGRREWRNLKENHPPRVGDDWDADTVKSDRMAGVNTSTVEDDLVFASVVSPEFPDRAAFDEWADRLSEGEWQVILTDAWRLVNVAQFDPKALPSSLTRSGATN